MIGIGRSKTREVLDHHSALLRTKPGLIRLCRLELPDNALSICCPGLDVDSRYALRFRRGVKVGDAEPSAR